MSPRSRSQALDREDHHCGSHRDEAFVLGETAYTFNQRCRPDIGDHHGTTTSASKIPANKHLLNIVRHTKDKRKLDKSFQGRDSTKEQLRELRLQDHQRGDKTFSVTSVREQKRYMKKYLENWSNQWQDLDCGH